jgi:hypothetical protein
VILIILLGAYVLLWGSSHPNEPVWVTKNFKLLTPEVKANSDLMYVATLDAKESCPGRVTHTFASDDTSIMGGTITITRPLVRPGVDVVDRTFSVSLPTSVFPGKWKVVLTINSLCPTRKQDDDLATFTIKVEP